MTDTQGAREDAAWDGSAASATQISILKAVWSKLNTLAGGVSGSLMTVAGNVASGVADSGNPVKVGGKYNSAAPTLVDGNRGDAQLDVNGNLKVSQATLIAGEDLTVGVLKVEERFSYQNITTATTTTVKSGAGFLHCLTVNTTAAGTIKLWDNTAASGTAIGTLKASVVENTYYYDVAFSTGLTVVTAGASDVTVSYR